MGPTSEVSLSGDDWSTLDAIDGVLASLADSINRTRKGRVWDVWVRGRPVHIQISGSPPKVGLAAGCREAEDYAVLRELGTAIAVAVGGIASEPEK